MYCYAPSEFMDREEAALFGTLAEKIIMQHYLYTMGRTGVFPASMIDYADFSWGFSNTHLYIAFLKMHHPNLSASALMQLSSDGLVKIPDILSHAPPTQTEFYEIKPDSGSGRSAGRRKIAEIRALMQYHHLPYVPGELYSPYSQRVRFFNGVVLGVGIELHLQFSRIAPGFLVYKVCVDVKGQEVLEKAALAIAALILTIMLRGRIRYLTMPPVPVA